MILFNPSTEIQIDIKNFEEDFAKTIQKFSRVPYDRIGEVELSILFLALYELSQTNLDRPIIINEAIKLAKKFGQNSSHKFINAILDSVIKS